MKRRRSGILLHVTSLPSPYGIGDFGPGAYAFVDFLSESGQSLWQILPLNPSHTGTINSPYDGFSAFAGNPLLISPEALVKDGYLDRSDIRDHPPFSDRSVHYRAVSEYKQSVLEKAFEKNRDNLECNDDFLRFRKEHAHWLEDFTLYVALKRHFKGKKWSAWPGKEKRRGPELENHWRNTLGSLILRETFLQFLFYRQWASLKRYCNDRNIQIIGDIPIYVNFDSCDVWSRQDIFKLDRRGQPLAVAGVPPDYFSATGQLWGNPVYDWNRLKEKGYEWWIARLDHNFRLFDITRIDHFRGFVGYWEVSYEEKTALKGKWVEAPARDFFTMLQRHFTSLPIIAEDLGVITPDVREVMNEFGFPGMKLLLFAFEEDNPSHPYLPHNYTENCIVYTGTHDNNTSVGWFRNDAGEEARKRIASYTGKRVTSANIHSELMRLAMSSVAHTAIFPMQDILGLGAGARMNNPSTKRGNWKWRLESRLVTSSLAGDMRELTKRYGRL